MSRCAMCREQFALLAVTYDADGDEICEDCDASLGPFRPSEDYVISLLRSVARGETGKDRTMTFDDAWPTLPIPGEFDAMDALDQLRWRAVIEMAYHLGGMHALEKAQAREDALATAERLST